MDRAYSILTVKAVEEDKRIIAGVASTPAVDRVGDILEPLGMKFAASLPLLLFHQADKPVGTVKLSKPTKAGVEFEARLPLVLEAGTLRDRVDEAWQSIKHKLIAGVSIGFRPFKDAIEPMENGGLRFLETEILELSLVTVPANQDATIQVIKSIDTEQRAASGQDLPDETTEELPEKDASAAIGKKARIVRLNEPARDGAKPFVIRTIKRLT